MLSNHLLWPKEWHWRGDQTPASMSPPAEGRSGPTNTPVSPPGSFVLPSFVWFYILLSCGQVLLPALSWCSESTSVSEGVFLMYSWREMPSVSTDSSVILFLSNHFIPAAPFSFCLQSFLESGPDAKSALCIRWPNYWSFNFSISSSNEHSGLISFRIDWITILVIQGTCKSLLQHHNLEALVFRPSAFFMIQLSHPYITTGKTTALTIQTFVDKVYSKYCSKEILGSLVYTFPTSLTIRYLIRPLGILKIQSKSHLVVQYLKCFESYPLNKFFQFTKPHKKVKTVSYPLYIV